MNTVDKGLLCFFFAMVCFFLVIDELYGRKGISNFIGIIIPKAKEKDD